MYLKFQKSLLLLVSVSLVIMILQTFSVSALSGITIISPQSTTTYTTKNVELNVSFNETYFSS